MVVVRCFDRPWMQSPAAASPSRPAQDTHAHHSDTLGQLRQGFPPVLQANPGCRLSARSTELPAKGSCLINCIAADTYVATTVYAPGH